MLVDIMDVEDLVKCSKELKACPYYASRMALDDAEVSVFVIFLLLLSNDSTNK